MKKIIASAVGLVLVSGVAVTAASAVESQFGGYWRTRSYFEKNWSQPNLSTQNATDTRTRLYYTAKFNDDFKFVNKFEFNTTWGDNNGGDVGADGKGNWRIKNSYADFTLGMVNTKVGIQPATINRGFVFSDDFSGIVATADFGKVKIPLLYGMISQEDAVDLGWDGSTAKSMGFITNSQNGKLTAGGESTDSVTVTGVDQDGNPASVTTKTGNGIGNGDIHLISLMPKFDITENISLNPQFTYANITHQDSYLWYAGTDIDAKFDGFTAWGTILHNGGQIDKDVTGGTSDSDISAWLFAGGADAGIFHGQGFYATGQDEDSTSTDIDSFVLIGSNGYGASYYWAEIMGLGTFDNVLGGSSANLGDKISNIMAANIGVTLKPMDKLTLGLDVWYAQLDEKVRVNGQLEDELGLEIDTKLTYQLMDNLKADFIYAYLFAGDAVGKKDVQEGGVQLSLSF
jgi:hypothetical protein